MLQGSSTPANGVRLSKADRGMEWLRCPDPSAAVSRFEGDGGTCEWQVSLTDAECAESLENRWLAALHAAGISPQSTVFRRVFCSDEVMDSPQIEAFSRAYPGGVSVIGQKPLAGGNYAIWSYHITDNSQPVTGLGAAHSFTVRRGALRHVWLSGLHDATARDPYAQAHAVLENHNRQLAAHGMTLEDNVIRTWWFVRDIDADYQGLVDARREVFQRHGLTEDTHYIASTGIAGGHPYPGALLSLDSYAIHGLQPSQVAYISATEFLGPTHMYGVTFERATSVTYSDRTHVFLSGTASIDPLGDIVHPGDVLRQLDRTIENIEALLAAAHAGLRDLSMILVYLRDPADGAAVERKVRERFGSLPMIVLHAPVCRPGWLVEIEGIACISSDRNDFPDF